MKKILAIVFVIALAVSMAACGGQQPATPSATAPAAPGTSEQTPAPAPSAGDAAGLSEPIAEQPVLLTSGGQSADYQMVGTILKNLGIEFTSENIATSANLSGFKTLIISVGGSSKGLGAAGIDADQEIARLNELIDAAEAAGMTIIAMHTGGESRRGDLSDRFIGPCFEKSDYAVIVSSGDSDGMMTGICSSNGIPVDVVSGIGDVAGVLPNAFK